MGVSSEGSMPSLTTFLKQQQQLWLQQYLTRTAHSGANMSQLAPLQQHAMYQLPHHRKMEYLLESQYLFQRFAFCPFHTEELLHCHARGNLKSK